MNNTCQISISGTDYYIPCDRINDLEYIDGYLVNISSSTITMRSFFSPDNFNTYPYITCSSMNICQLRSSNQISSYVNTNYNYSGDLFKIVNPGYVIMLLLFLILGVRIIWKR